MDHEEANALIERFGRELAFTTNRERRAAMTSPLYDLQGRSTLGFAAVHDLAPGLVERLERVMQAEEIGRRMRGLLVRPYFLQLFIFLEGYLMAREQRLIDAGGLGSEAEREADAERTTVVCDWFARVCAAYRSDDELFPGEHVIDEPILDRSVVERWEGREPLPREPADRAQRAIGTLELYALTVHGEQRDGNFDHGPYPTADGRQLVFHEVNDLANDFLPWVTEQERLEVDAVGVVRSFSGDVEIVCDMFGTSSASPAGASHEQLALLVRDRNGVREVDVEELASIAKTANQATARLFGRIATWEPEYRTAYGRPLFVNHLVPFARVAGAPEVERWLRQEGPNAGPSDLSTIAGRAAAEVWARLAAGAELFSPTSGVAPSR